MLPQRRTGSTHTEYVLIAAVVSVSVLIAVATIGDSIGAILTSIAEALGVF
jgi:Flp pilus assembly pilin Flp